MTLSFELILIHVYCCSIAQSCPNLCNTTDCSMPGFSVLLCLPELAQTQGHCVSDATQPSCLLLPTSPPALNLSQHQGLLKWVSSSSGGQTIGVSALASVFSKKSQGWCPSEWTGWVSLQSKGLSRVFSSTTVQKHQFFSAQLSSQSNPHIHTWLLEKP